MLSGLGVLCKFPENFLNIFLMECVLMIIGSTCDTLYKQIIFLSVVFFLWFSSWRSLITKHMSEKYIDLVLLAFPTGTSMKNCTSHVVY